MIFAFAVTTPPRTSKDNEMYTELPLTRGVVKEIEILFPPGCSGLVGCRFFRYAVQVLPSNFPSWFVSDSETVKCEMEIDCMAEPYNLVVGTYNEDDTYEHTLYIRVKVEVPTYAYPLPPARELSLEEMPSWLREMVGE